MSRKKKIMLALAVPLIAIQFIQPARNKSVQVLPAEFGNLYTVPDSVKPILQNACYDCHSNNTNYPWYTSIQPVGWIMAKHIKKGKEYLNFSEFGNYTNRRQISKLKSIINQIKDDEMPLSSYRIMHLNARLSTEEKKLITDWISKKVDSLIAN